MNSRLNIAKKEISLSDVELAVSQEKQLYLSKSAVTKITKCRDFLSKKITKSDTLIYGVNTGFGSLCNKKIDSHHINKLQKNLLLSHACGTGDKVPDEIVRIILLLKIRSLSLGYSGVRLLLIRELITYYNKNLLPVLFEQGSLGASGDLAPLAHLSLPLIGVGEFSINGSRVPARKVFKKDNKKNINLSFKEGLALLNGTQFMTGYGVWSILEAKKIYYFSTLIASIALEAFSCSKNPFHPLISTIKPHFGQINTANLVLNILKGSKTFFNNDQYVQDPYSFRCIPQVHGATLDVIKHVESILNIEINSVTDNPNIFYRDNQIISGGNFHGQSLALAMDYLALALSEIGNISERRVFQLISGKRGLPPYLIHDVGLNSGFMITQYTSASIVSQNKQYASPASIDSIVSSNGQEDHVSMGANSATKLYRIINNLHTILAIELFNAAQAIEMKGVETSPLLQKFLKSYRQHVPFIKKDKQLSIYIEKTKIFMSSLDICKLLDSRC